MAFQKVADHYNPIPYVTFDRPNFSIGACFLSIGVVHDLQLILQFQRFLELHYLNSSDVVRKKDIT